MLRTVLSIFGIMPNTEARQALPLLRQISAEGGWIGDMDERVDSDEFAAALNHRFVRPESAWGCGYWITKAGERALEAGLVTEP